MGKSLISLHRRLILKSRRSAGGELAEYSAILLFLAAVAILAIPAFQTAMTNSYDSTSSCIKAAGLGAGQTNCQSANSSSSSSHKGGSNGDAGAGRGETGGGGYGRLPGPP